MTIGDAAVRARGVERPARAPAARARSTSGSAYHGTAQMTTGALQPLIAVRPATVAAVRLAPHAIARGALVRTAPPRASMNARAGSAYSSSSGFSGSAERGVACGRGRTVRASTRANGAAAATSIGWFSAATASGSHSSSIEARRLAVAHEPLRARFRLRAAAACRRRRARPSGARIRSTARRSRQPSASQRHDAGQQVQRRRQRRAREPRRAPGAIDDVDRELLLDAHVRLGADAAQEAERLVVAAEEHVLAVVHALAGGRIGERRRAAAERRPRLEHQHARAALGQRRRGAQPGEAGADRRSTSGLKAGSARSTAGIGRHGQSAMAASSVRAQMRSAITRAVRARHADARG